MDALLLAQADPPSSWLPVLMLIIIGILFVGGAITLSILVGPSRTNPGKEGTYESGMNPVGDSRKLQRPLLRGRHDLPGLRCGHHFLLSPVRDFPPDLDRQSRAGRRCWSISSSSP